MVKAKVKVEPCSITYPPVQKCTIPPSTPGEKVRSCERSMEKALDSEKKQEKLISQQMRNVLSCSGSNHAEWEEWILKREGNKAYAKDGNILYTCEFCRRFGKPMFFATQTDLDRHVTAFHTGRP